MHRILLVDDDPHLLSALARHFRPLRAEWSVDTAEGGREALDLMAVEPYEVVVSDERMPGMRGSELLAIVRQKYPETIRIILSGQAGLEDVIEAINSAEIYRFLRKPCSPEEIAATIREALGRREERLGFEHWRDRQLAQGREGLDDAFDEALGKLWMSYQPLVRAADSRVFGYEALVRGDHPELRMPSSLFAAAEDLERTLELGSTIRRSVAASAPQIPDSALLFVNVNPRDLDNEDLFDPAAPLSEYAERVILEITERETLSAFTDLSARLERLRGLGFRLAVDDLGAGYAGLTSLALLQPEFVKLDMDLVRNIDCSPTKKELVRSMIGLCRNLGITSVAEGVEMEVEREVLVDLGCDVLQGFLFGGAQRVFAEGKRTVA